MASTPYLFTTSIISHAEMMIAMNSLSDRFQLAAPHFQSQEGDSCQAARSLSEIDLDLGLLRQAAAEMSLDVNKLTITNTPKALLMADMDATMILGESLDELATLAGIGPEIAQITARAMAGELDFEAALTARLSLLEGEDASLLDKVIENTVITCGAATLVATMRSQGHHAYLVSGGFTFLTRHVAAELGFSGHHANEIEIKNGVLSGGFLPPLLDKSAKARILAELCLQHDITAHDVIAVGDGANDLEMLTAAGLGIAFEGKPALRAQISDQLSFSDLSALLYLQSYDRADFITP